MKPVLVAVDMQNDFVTGALGSAEAQAIESRVADKIRRFDGEIFYTLDTHAEDYMNTQEGRRLPVPHCIRDTEGWRLTPTIRAALAERQAAGEEHRLIKNTFGAVHLAERIRERCGGAPDCIELIGLCTDICVISNAMLLKAAFPEARIAVDASCCAGVSPESHQCALAAMRVCQIDVEGAFSLSMQL